jgi:hypothetical protein
MLTILSALGFTTGGSGSAAAALMDNVSSNAAKIEKRFIMTCFNDVINKYKTYQSYLNPIMMSRKKV